MMAASEIAPASPVDVEFEKELATLLTTLDIPKDTPRTQGTALLFAHQLPTWVSVTSHQGRKCRPWAVDVVFPSSCGVVPIRLGNGQLFGSQPSWTAQVVALLEHCVAGKFVGVRNQ